MLCRKKKQAIGGLGVLLHTVREGPLIGGRLSRDPKTGKSGPSRDLAGEGFV